MSQIDAKVIDNQGVISNVVKSEISEEVAIFHVRKSVAYVVARRVSHDVVVFDAGNEQVAAVCFSDGTDVDAYMELIIQENPKDFTIMAMNADAVSCTETIYRN